MFTIYILRSVSAPKTYVGYTNDVKRRLREHNAGQVPFTRRFRPWSILHTESAKNEKFAKDRERYWKSGAGRRNIKRLLNGEEPRLRSK